MSLRQQPVVGLAGSARRTQAASALRFARRFLKPALVVVVSLSIGYALASGWVELSAVEWRFEPALLAVAFAAFLVQVCLVAPLWVTICQGLGGPIPMRAGVRAHLLANLGKYLPGKVMHAIALAAMAREFGVSGPIGVTSILLEVVFTVLGAGLVAVSGLTVVLAAERWFLIPLTCASLIGSLIVVHPGVLGFALRTVARVIPATRGQLGHIGLPYLTMLKLLGLYAASWTLVAVGLFAAAGVVHPIDNDLFIGVIGITALGYLAGLVVPFAPAGVGAREGTTAFLLSTILGVPPAAAAAVSVLARVIAILAEVTAALVASRL